MSQPLGGEPSGGLQSAVAVSSEPVAAVDQDVWLTAHGLRGAAGAAGLAPVVPSREGRAVSGAWCFTSPLGHLFSG